LARQLKKQHKRETAIIFGSLPPLTKLEQAAKFNDLDHPCKVLLATDAIGMGINLNIRRVIFYSVIRLNREVIPAYHAQQIAGRAGRYRHHWESGTVMAYKDDDNELLAGLMAERIPDVEQAGINPNFEQLETFSYHLPNASLAQLLDIFLSICTIHPHYFSCGMESIREVASAIEHIKNLPLRDRYTFCLVPVKMERKALMTALVKFVKRYAANQLITYDYFHQQIKPLLIPAAKIEQLMDLNDAYDAVGIYLWLSYRFPVCS